VTQWSFLLRRFGRLYPLHVFTLAVMVLLEFAKLVIQRGAHVSSGEAPFAGDNSVIALVGNLFLLNGLGFFGSFTWNGPSWSISAEFYTYLLFLLVSFAGWKKQKYIAILIVIVAAVSLGFNAYTHTLKTATGQGMISCIYGFFLGTVSYGLFRYLAERTIPPRWLEWVAIAGALVAFTYTAPLESVIRPLVFAAVVIVFAFEGGAASKVLQTGFIHKLGIVSYSIYLVHFPLITIMNGAVRVAQSKLHRPLMHVVHGKLLIDTGSSYLMDALTVVYITIVILVAFQTFKYVEEPARLYFNSLASRPRLPKILEKHAVDSAGAE
jgi:peptidoglycan/LPS O-acetylase OafA/YrhL